MFNSDTANRLFAAAFSVMPCAAVNASLSIGPPV